MWLLPGGLDVNPGKDGFCLFVLQERLCSPLSIARFSGSASGFVHFHVNRSHLFLIAETVGRLVWLGDPRPDGRAARFRRGAKQRLAKFHHLSFEALRRWPRAGV
jgi:hypothetical protein